MAVRKVKRAASKTAAKRPAPSSRKVAVKKLSKTKRQKRASTGMLKKARKTLKAVLVGAAEGAAKGAVQGAALAGSAAAGVSAERQSTNTSGKGHSE